MNEEFVSNVNQFMTLDLTGCRINQITIKELFDLYYQARFLYASKAKQIEPYLPSIFNNLEKALQANQDLLKIISYEDPQGHMASLMLWRYSQTTWCAQHLVSSGGHISHIPLLSAQGSFILSQESNNPQFFNSWYRPDNKLPHLCFGKSAEAIGYDKMSLTKWNYFICDQIKTYSSKNVKVEYCRSSNFEDFKNFYDSMNEKVWWNSEQFDPVDIELTTVKRNVSIRRA